jgi:hypothetical protein
MIEASSKKEIDILGEKIGEKCGEELEVQVQKLGNQRLDPNNIPEDITTENSETTIIEQNPDMDLNVKDIRAKFFYTTKRKTSNLIVEVDSETRKKILQTRIKIGCSICRAFNYLVAKRCFRCSGYNHGFLDCKGEKICPPCAGSYRLKECTADNGDHKYINCFIYNRQHRTNRRETAHSSLDTNCPSQLAAIDKYKQNTNY